MTEHNNEVIGKGKENVDDGSVKSDVRNRRLPTKYQDYVTTFDKKSTVQSHKSTRKKSVSTPLPTNCDVSVFPRCYPPPDPNPICPNLPSQRKKSAAQSRKSTQKKLVSTPLPTKSDVSNFPHCTPPHINSINEFPSSSILPSQQLLVTKELEDLNPSYPRFQAVYYKSSESVSYCIKCLKEIPDEALVLQFSSKKTTRSVKETIHIHPSCLNLRGPTGITGLELLKEEDREKMQLLMRDEEKTEVLSKGCFSIGVYKTKPPKFTRKEECSFNTQEKLVLKDLFKEKVKKVAQATFNSIPELTGTTIIVSGDGHGWSKDAIQIIIKMALSNGVQSIWVGKNGLMSTPAVSAVLRKRIGANGSKASGAFVLTASHNPGRPHEDFEIKYIMENGGPPAEEVAIKIDQNLKTLTEDDYSIAKDLPDVDLSKEGVLKFEGSLYVDVFDSANDYVKLMKSIFDFKSIRKLMTSSKFSFCYDALHGVAGAYANRIFVQELGAEHCSLINCVTTEALGGGHPDSNRTRAIELVSRMGLGKPKPKTKRKSKYKDKPEASRPPEFGAGAAFGDAESCMIFGNRFFVTPSDSVAIIAAHAFKAIPYFSEFGLKGLARSMPTSAALDVVARKLEVNCFEVPIEWKSFRNLITSEKCSIGGDENFGLGACGICEKDGIWAVLAWLSILAYANKDKLQGDEKLHSVQDIVLLHWRAYGRHYYTRYDYKNVDIGAAKDLMEYLVDLQASLSKVNKIIKGIRSDVADVIQADVFEYRDPVDGSISKRQGFRFLFADESRLVFRISANGPEDAMIQLHIEQPEYDPEKFVREPEEALDPLYDVALKLSKIEEITGITGLCPYPSAPQVMSNA